MNNKQRFLLGMFGLMNFSFIIGYAGAVSNTAVAGMVWFILNILIVIPFIVGGLEDLK